jgi:small-conductance mechanosensitive channel
VVAKAGKWPCFATVILLVASSMTYVRSLVFPNRGANDPLFILKMLSVFLLWGLFFLGLWFIWNISTAIQNILQHEKLYKPKSLINIVLPVITKILHALVLLISVNIIIPELHLPDYAKYYSDKILQIYFILTIGWIFYHIINGVEKIILRQFDINDLTNFSGRKVQTQVLILKRIIYSIGGIVIFASALFVFENAKRLGMGLLTTAGVVSAGAVFASQQSLSRLLSGLQLAFTQPIRIGDSVIVDEQMGVVEEIAISYVVVKLWDLRRLIVPTDKIMSRGFQNLTRTSTQLLGTIFFYADYLLPIDVVREQFTKLVSRSTFWDKNVCTLQVTELKDHTVEIRGLVSAKNGSDLWSLRCEVRENMLAFIVNHFPSCLPRLRQVNLDQ